MRSPFPFLPGCRSTAPAFRLLLHLRQRLSHPSGIVAATAFKDSWCSKGLQHLLAARPYFCRRVRIQPYDLKGYLLSLSELGIRKTCGIHVEYMWITLWNIYLE